MLLINGLSAPSANRLLHITIEPWEGVHRPVPAFLRGVTR